MDNELLLFDRIDKIQAINKQYNLLENAYISFSGGKDSTILHYLIDKALPNNKIPRVYINTGIEYKDIVEYVKELAKNDDRIIIINSGVNIKEMLEKNGYPFKSKEHSHKIEMFQKGSSAKTIIDYKNNNDSRSCPKILKYQLTKEFNIKISDKCCYKLKKQAAKNYMNNSGKTITITGMRASEGGLRELLNNCIITKNNKLQKFHPLLVVSEDFEKWFIEQEKIKLCKLYYEPYNFKRTGCKGCPYALGLQEELDKLEKLSPSEYKQCEFIWQPIYAEYRRLGYRLRKNGYKQLSIFDL